MKNTYRKIYKDNLFKYSWLLKMGARDNDHLYKQMKSYNHDKLQKKKHVVLQKPKLRGCNLGKKVSKGFLELRPKDS